MMFPSTVRCLLVQRLSVVAVTVGRLNAFVSDRVPRILTFGDCNPSPVPLRGLCSLARWLSLLGVHHSIFKELRPLVALLPLPPPLSLQPLPPSLALDRHQNFTTALHRHSCQNTRIADRVGLFVGAACHLLPLSICATHPNTAKSMQNDEK